MEPMGHVNKNLQSRILRGRGNLGTLDVDGSIIRVQ